MNRDEIGLILEAMEQQRQILQRVAEALERSQWECGCGTVNSTSRDRCRGCQRVEGHS